MKVIEISKEDLKYNLNIISNILNNESENKVRNNSCSKS